MTIRSLLQNTSGRYYNFASDFNGLPAMDNQSMFAIGVGRQAPPDAEWFYNNTAMQVLEGVVGRATGQDVEAFAQVHLFGSLGAERGVTGRSFPPTSSPRPPPPPPI